MKKVQIKIVNNDVSSNDVTNFLKKIDLKDSKKIEVLFDNGNIIKAISSISTQAIFNELNKEFNVQFEIREID